jgi:hypothetical protein
MHCRRSSSLRKSPPGRRGAADLATWWEEHLADASAGAHPDGVRRGGAGWGAAGYVAFVRATKRSGSVVVAELVATDDEYARELLDFVRELADGSSIRLRAQPVDVVALLERAADREASSAALAEDRRRRPGAFRFGGIRPPRAQCSRYVTSCSRRIVASSCSRPTTTGLFRSHRPTTRRRSRSTSGVLGRVFLGGSTFSELAASGEIVVSDVSVLAGIDRAFATTGTPFCSTLALDPGRRIL